ncbi:unnamed protein product [Dovyalis caffra]|uniref:Uncharacterized protein n=1 Tax=Dovyalis caffra TaxID=77055 RepID=A0AAV1QMV5_9ROSI|nr:unnamed protein product [Dovyalis caffra]
MGNPHIVVVPYPAQGHVIPFMELSQCLAKQGFKITFVNTEYNHNRVLKALGENSIGGEISLVSLPDGLEPSGDRNDLGKLSKSIFQVMPGKLEELIDRINMSEEENVTCIITDWSMGWALEVAEKMKIRRSIYWPAAAALLCSLICIPKLLSDGVIDGNGTPLKNRKIHLTPTMPEMDTANFVWACLGGFTAQKIIFDLMVKTNETAKTVDRIISNSAYDLEPGAFSFAPNILPIGPLLASNWLGDQRGYFWPEDSTCLKWLDQQPPMSVVYVAFGSFTVFDKTQFQELALGLELSNRPFLWVVRPDITTETNDAYPEGFQERVATRGRMIGWAPQQKVLSHPSISCFLSHCGWNSTMEGLSNGVPFLCWPYFADQFLNETYICDVWKVGLKIDKNNSGIITGEEIKNKVETVVGDENFRTRAAELKRLAKQNVGEAGYSSENFKNFIEWIKS